MDSNRTDAADRKTPVVPPTATTHAIAWIDTVVSGKYRIDRVLSESHSHLALGAWNVALGCPVEVHWFHPRIAHDEAAVRSRLRLVSPLTALDSWWTSNGLFCVVPSIPRIEATDPSLKRSSATIATPEEPTGRFATDRVATEVRNRVDERSSVPQPNPPRSSPWGVLGASAGFLVLLVASFVLTRSVLTRTIRSVVSAPVVGATRPHASLPSAPEPIAALPVGRDVPIEVDEATDAERAPRTTQRVRRTTMAMVRAPIATAPDERERTVERVTPEWRDEPELLDPWTTARE